jgi:hypothetical protein
VKAEGGEVIRSITERWAFWFRGVKHFAWHLLRAPVPPEERYRHETAVAAAPAGVSFIYPEWRSLAETRFGEPIGIDLRLVGVAATVDKWGQEQIREVAQAGRIYWLPELTELPCEQGVDLLLREFLGVAAEAPKPQWIEAYSLPRETAALREVEERRKALEGARRSLREAEAAAEREARFGKLLHEQGKEALEPVVRETLSQLGAEVQEPVKPGIEDGRIVDPGGRTAMLEIKGLTGQLRLEDVRQLDGWMRTAIAEGWDGKGMIVANLKLSDAPPVRSDLVAPNAVAFAERVGICILTTPQLFEALRRQQDGELDAKSFWDVAFATSGLAALPDPKT